MAAVNEEYRRLYMELYDLLDRAYMDRYMLEELLNYRGVVIQQTHEIKTRADYVLRHTFHVLKEDLCLTLCVFVK